MNAISTWAVELRRDEGRGALQDLDSRAAVRRPPSSALGPLPAPRWSSRPSPVVDLGLTDPLAQRLSRTDPHWPAIVLIASNSDRVLTQPTDSATAVMTQFAGCLLGRDMTSHPRGASPCHRHPVTVAVPVVVAQTLESLR